MERVHNLFKLYAKIDIYLNFDVGIEMLEILDKVYTASRYPGEVGLMPFGKPSIEEATGMLEFAKYIYAKTLEMLTN